MKKDSKYLAADLEGTLVPLSFVATSSQTSCRGRHASLDPGSEGTKQHQPSILPDRTLKDSGFWTYSRHHLQPGNYDQHKSTAACKSFAKTARHSYWQECSSLNFLHILWSPSSSYKDTCGRVDQILCRSERRPAHTASAQNTRYLHITSKHVQDRKT